MVVSVLDRYWFPLIESACTWKDPNDKVAKEMQPMKVHHFKTVVANVANVELLKAGYDGDINPPEGEDLVWFRKTLRPGIHVVIEFQGSGVALKDVADFAINLTRNHYDYDREDILPGYSLSARLASWLWIEDRLNPQWESDHWWHFLNEEELENACLDALDKLLKYGIPWVENLASTRPH
jgi:hypothetical protein